METTLDHLMQPEVLAAMPNKNQLFYKLASSIDWDVWPKSQDILRLKVLVRLGTIILDEVEQAMPEEPRVNLFQQVLDAREANDESIERMVGIFNQRQIPSVENKQKQIDTLVGQLEQAMQDIITGKVPLVATE